MTFQQLATYDLKRLSLGYVKLVIGLECFLTLTNIVENVLYAKALSHQLQPMLPWSICPLVAWEMVAVDILEVLLSYNNNRYLLVIQDYMTK